MVGTSLIIRNICNWNKLDKTQNNKSEDKWRQLTIVTPPLCSPKVQKQLPKRYQSKWNIEVQVALGKRVYSPV